MKTVILCGGRGMRMSGETEFKPKPLVEIGGYPILFHIIQIYASQGFHDFILCLGYKGNKIKQYINDLNLLTNDVEIDMKTGINNRLLTQKSGIEGKIICADTDLDSMTGSRITKVEKYLKGEENFFLTYGDGLGNIDLNELLQFHIKKDKILTITGVRPQHRYGLLDIDEEDIATRFYEKPEGKDVVNGGFMVCNHQIFKYLSQDPNCILEKDPMEQLTTEHQMAVYPHYKKPKAFWKSMDNHKEAEELNTIWESGNPPWKAQ